MHRAAKGCNIRDVAEKANVSPGTVSRVLNNRMGVMRVSDATKKLIVQCAKELDYQPNINARRLFSKRSRVIGLVIPSFREIGKNAFEDRHIINLLSGIESVLSARKYKLMILFKDREFIESGEHLSLFGSKQIDGLLVWGAYWHELFWNELADKNYPHIFITTYPDQLKDEKLVFSADYGAAGYDTMRHLLTRGYDNILWIKPADDSSIYFELNMGFNKAFKDEKRSREKILSETACDYSPASGYKLMERLQKDAKRKYSALLFTSRETADGAVDYCMRHGLRMPEDIAVAACDSTDQRDRPRQITCSWVDDLLLGSTAVEALLALIEKKELPVNHRIRTSLLTGDTA